MNPRRTREQAPKDRAPKEGLKRPTWYWLFTQAALEKIVGAHRKEGGGPNNIVCVKEITAASKRDLERE